MIEFISELINLGGDNPIVAALIIILYFQYELRFGTLRKHFDRIDAVVSVVIGLASKSNHIDERSVIDELDASDSRKYFSNERELPVKE